MPPPISNKKSVTLFYKLPGSGTDPSLPYTIANLNRAIFANPDKPLLKIIEQQNRSGRRRKELEDVNGSEKQNKHNNFDKHSKLYLNNADSNFNEGRRNSFVDFKTGVKRCKNCKKAEANKRRCVD